MIEHIPDMIEAGIDSFKIEGRMKAALYVAVVARTYRHAIDDYLKDPELYRAHMDWYKAEIEKCTMRPFTTGFFYGKPDTDAQIYDNNTYIQDYIYLGMCGDIREDGSFFLEQKNKFSVGEKVELLMADGTNLEADVLSITDDQGTPQESAPHARQHLYVKLREVPEPGVIIRKTA